MRLYCNPSLGSKNNIGQIRDNLHKRLKPKYFDTFWQLRHHFIHIGSRNGPGGNHAYSRAFSAYFPRIFRARGECAENTRRIRGECAENTRQRNAYFPRIIRAFSAHLKIKKGPIFLFFKIF